MENKTNCEKCNDTAFRFYQVESDQRDAITWRFELCTCVAAMLYIERLKRAMGIQRKRILHFYA